MLGVTRFTPVLVGFLALGLVIGCSTPAAPAPTSAAPKASEPAKVTEPTKAPAAAPAASGKTITIKANHDEPVDFVTDKVLKEMAESVAKKTNGAIKMEVYPGCQLAGGSIKTMTQMTQAGQLELSFIATSTYNNWEQKFDALSLPFLYRSIDDLWRVTRDPLAQELLATTDKTGLKTVDMWARDLRQWVNRTRQIRTPEDIKGLKFRVPEISIWVATFKALGATAVPMPFAEAYTAVQLKTLDGAERPTEFIEGEKWVEIAKYLTGIDYTGDVLLASFNKTFFESLPKEYQELLTVEIQAAGKKKYEMEKVNRAQIFDRMAKAGMDVAMLTDQEKKAFRDATKSVWTEWEGKVGKDLISRVEKIATQ